MLQKWHGSTKEGVVCIKNAYTLPVNLVPDVPKVILLHKSIVKITDIKGGTKSHTCSLDAGDKKTKQNVCGKTSVKVATWKTMRWQNKIKMDLGEINCDSGMAEADGNRSVTYPVPDISYCCAKPSSFNMRGLGKFFHAEKNPKVA